MTEEMDDIVIVCNSERELLVDLCIVYLVFVFFNWEDL